MRVNLNCPQGRGEAISDSDDNKKHDELVKIYSRMPKKYWSRKKQRDEQASRLGWLVDKIWPEGTIHLIAGPSGVGKSSWLLPAVKDWSEGKPILGFPSHPKPFVYLMCDRSEIELFHTLNRLGLGEWDIPAYSIESLGHDPRCMIEPSTLTIESLPGIFPWAKVFFIEAYHWFYKSESKSQTSAYANTLRFWSSVRDAFCQKDLTIVATTHEAKGNEYVKTRDKVYGNVGQVAVSGTIITMEYDEKDDDTRILRVAPRDSKEFTCQYKFDETGKLVFQGNIAAEQTLDGSAFRELDRKLRRVAPGVHIPTMTIIEWGMDLKLSGATVERWITKRVTEGKLIRIARGLYMIPKTEE